MDVLEKEMKEEEEEHHSKEYEASKMQLLEVFDKHGVTKDPAFIEALMAWRTD